jgi:sugar diacid utilization regulator
MSNEKLIALLMDERNVTIILALADHNLNVSRVCKAVFMSRSTVQRHIKKIKRVTGLDATAFHDLCKLMQMVGERKDNG